MAIAIVDFGCLADGRKVEKYNISNSRGTVVSLLTYGATLASVITADKNGELADVIVSFDDLEGFVERTDYQGVVVGPYANRIGNSEFSK